ncbi:SusC/RagA family TonB-linked outer membrane protein [Desertivirga arenae]|uniref:SusC/RagA family TonB-linked outer membrane protein n=1 Tax=Desertivirga arenae TaxID=2810309 RepID=UPI001A974108|nr:TonB-dependent receptor [Pedobacter sp. SYSU D00823]
MRLNLKRFLMLLLFILAGSVSIFAQKPDQNITINGVVVDQNKRPLAGVNISVQESKSKSLNTGAEGLFAITCTSSDAIVFQLAGYRTLIKPAAELKDATIILERSLLYAGDQDNVYIPFGVRKKRQVSATISSIDGDQLPQLPSSSLNTVLSGRVSGLYIYQNGSQQPGYDVSSFMIRGRSSYNNNQEPLVLVDGVARAFEAMDPNEIESISVLKDAASLSWYGMYGANGIIYVKTKRGSATQTRVTVDAQNGWQTPMQIAQPLDSYTFASLYNEAQINSGSSPTYSDATLAAYRDPSSNPYLYPNNNFVDRFTKDITPVQRYIGTVSGGNAFIKYYTMISYLNQAGFYQGAENPLYDANTNFKRYNLRTNLDLHVNKSLDVSLDVGGRITNLRFPRVGTSSILSAIYSTPANAFPVLNEDGTYGGTSNFQSNNPLAMLQAGGVSTDVGRNMLATINVRQKLGSIIDGLSLNALYSYDVRGLFRHGFTQTYEVYQRNDNGSYARFGNATVANYSANEFRENFRNNELWIGFDYDKSFGDHSFNFSNRFNRTVATTFLALDEKREGISNRLTYGYKQRYFIDLIGSYYGSENFKPGKRYGFFPAFSAGWIVSDENFMKSASFLDYLKLRGSYGLMGSDALGLSRRFSFNSTWNRGGTGYNFGTGFNGANGSTERTLGNENLTWEKVKKASLGFDSQLFKQALSLSADYFYENRSDLLTGSLLPNILGQSLVNVNEGEGEYRGVEADININKKIGNLNLSLFGNYTYTKSKIVSINESAGLPDYQKRKGHAISSVIQGNSYVNSFLKADGIFQNQAEIDKAPVQRFSRTVKPGDIRYKDINGDNVIDNLDFSVTDYNFVPKAFFGFGANASYKSFDISFLFQGTEGRTISIKDLVNAGSNNTGYVNQFSVNRWTPETAGIAEYPRLAIGDRDNNTQNSDFWLRSGDYLRLKNAELGYTLPASLTSRIKLSTCRFFISGLNLLTFDKLKGLDLDPELPDAGYSTYPYMRIYSMGLNVKF